VASANLGRVDNPSFILRDGRYWEAGGERVSDNIPGDRNQAEIYDPVHDQWTRVSNDNYMMRDSPATLLSDGNTILAGPGLYDYSIWLYNVSADRWTPSSHGPPDGQSNEGGSLLLPDGRVFAGHHRFSLYQPDDDSWVPTSPTIPPTNAFATDGEIGAFLLLPSGNVLVLGGNNHNGIYSPASDQWLTGRDGVPGMVADTPGGLGHGDVVAAVEPNGRVLAIASDGETGTASTTILEYCPNEDVWLTVPSPDGFGNPASGTTRMLALPVPGAGSGVGQIMMTNSGKAWFYTPSDDALPSDDWRPSLATAWVAFGQYHATGTQLNGLTTGADLGDDARMATNYPIAWVDNINDPNHRAYFARASNVDQMAPRPSTSGVFSFDMPPLGSAGIGGGTWRVHVAANGLESSNTVNLTVTSDRGWGFVPLLQF